MTDPAEIDNQSVFVLDSEMAGPPPETVLTPEQQAKTQKSGSKRKKMVIFGLIGIISLAGLTIAGKILWQPETDNQINLTPTPIPVKNFTQMEKELARLEETVSAANPNADLLALPPIADNLTF